MTSSISSSSPDGSTPNSNLVSARMIPARSHDPRAVAVQRDRGVADPRRELRPDQRLDALERDVLVVLAHRRLRGRA